MKRSNFDRKFLKGLAFWVGANLCIYLASASFPDDPTKANFSPFEHPIAVLFLCGMNLVGLGLWGWSSD